MMSRLAGMRDRLRDRFSDLESGFQIDRVRLRRTLMLAQFVAAPVGLVALGWLLVLELPVTRIRDNAGAIALAVAVGVLGLVLFAVRLRLLLPVFDLRAAPRDVWRIHVVSLFYYFFLPAGVGYDLVRMAKLGAAMDHRPRARRLAALALGERAVGGFSVFVLLVVALPFIHLVEDARLRWLEPPAWLWIAAVLAALAAIGTAAVLARRRLPTLAGLLPATAASTGCYLLIAAAVWLAAEAMGIRISLAEVLVALAGTLLFQLVPVNLLGVSFGEVAAIAVYLAFGLEHPDALMLTTLAYLQRLGAAIIGGAIEARHSFRWLSHNGFGPRG